MKVIFLDVDGVLNMHNSGGVFTLNKKRIKLLSDIVKETQAKIVVTSTWRYIFHARQKLAQHLSYKSLSIYDWTDRDGPTRADEIKRWVDKHSPESYVILDDENLFFLEQIQRVVYTDGNVGLTKKHVEKAIRVLNES